MAHINLPEGLPGIRGPMAFRPETAKPLNELAETLLRDDNNTLTRGERELIATYVSYLNDCFFCQNAHGGIAQYYLQCDMQFIDGIKEDFNSMAITDKMKKLLSVATSVQKGGRFVTAEQIEAAKNAGATDIEIHDTVLIAAAFVCSIVMWMDWELQRRRTGIFISEEESKERRKVIYILTFINKIKLLYENIFLAWLHWVTLI
jgi:uncharacterized peroxidase-related enzyme